MSLSSLKSLSSPLFHISLLSTISSLIVTPLKEIVKTKTKPDSEREMADWAPVFVAVVLFILLSPGLLIQIPGRGRYIEFSTFHTSGVSILVHAVLFFALICIFLFAIGIHLYLGKWNNRFITFLVLGFFRFGSVLVCIFPWIESQVNFALFLNYLIFVLELYIISLFSWNLLLNKNIVKSVYF